MRSTPPVPVLERPAPDQALLAHALADVPVLTGIGSACPPSVSQEELWDGYFAERLGADRRARFAFVAAGVRHRHAAVDPRVEDVSQWSTGRRMARYLSEAMPLASAAATRALTDVGRSPSEIGLLVVTSCTGYTTPGIDVLLARGLGLPDDTRRVLLGHLGCHAALPALATAAEFVAARHRPALLLSLELSSLHLQPPSTDLEQAVVHALFSDAAAAVVLEPSSVGPLGAGSLEVLDHEARSDLAAADHMTWQVTDLGFRMTLSREVPRAVGDLVGPLVDGLLERHGLKRRDVDRWAVHPGGPRLLEVTGRRLGLSSAALEDSATVLAEHGNCSSATVLLVLEQLCRTRAVRPGEHVVLLAFGPGLTCYATLLRGR